VGQTNPQQVTASQIDTALTALRIKVDDGPFRVVEVRITSDLLVVKRVELDHDGKPVLEHRNVVEKGQPRILTDAITITED